MHCNRLASTTQAAAARRRIGCVHSPFAPSGSMAICGADCVTPSDAHRGLSTPRGRAKTT